MYKTSNKKIGILITIGDVRGIFAILKTLPGYRYVDTMNK